MAHCLIVGGTGMLRNVGVVFAEAGHRVSVVARNKERLIGLVRDTQRSPGVINPIVADYTQTEEFEKKIGEAIAILGPISVAVLWIHANSGDAAGAVSRLLGNQTEPCQVYHVLGSQAADPTKQTADRSPFEQLEHVSCRSVVLGFKQEPAGSRWLTDDEIASGVLDAIANDRIDSVVGTVEPWDERPGA
ncbi:short-chain dehydrogenase [bacterium]|nr:short-chain dehydrogenase [bacterium]